MHQLICVTVAVSWCALPRCSAPTNCLNTLTSTRLTLMHDSTTSLAGTRSSVTIAYIYSVTFSSLLGAAMAQCLMQHTCSHQSRRYHIDTRSVAQVLVPFQPFEPAPRAGSRVARCRKRRLNQALSACLLAQVSFDVYVLLLTRDCFQVVLFLCYLCVLSLGCSQVVSTSASD